MKVAIIYNQFFDRDGREQLIGGIETYILNLARLCIEVGVEPILFQGANSHFEKDVDGLKVVGVCVSDPPRRPDKVRLYKAAGQQIDLTKDLIIFGADHFSIRTDNVRTISIQHGVSWDLPTKYFTKKSVCRSGLGARVKKYKKIRAALRYFDNCQNRVCVDYNFLNWYRTMRASEIAGRIWVIPNFARIATHQQVRERDNSVVRVIFARRFVPYRGTRLISAVLDRILAQCQDFEFTFAGEGPDEAWLRKHFAGQERVKFVRFSPEDSLKVHIEHDIAVVPSIASEGTSLSVAEAMGAGCAVVATAVGGITNMIIDSYNGLLAMPNEESLLSKLSLAIKSPSLRQNVGERARETARNAFNLESWKRKWRIVINQVGQL